MGKLACVAVAALLAILLVGCRDNGGPNADALARSGSSSAANETSPTQLQGSSATKTGTTHGALDFGGLRRTYRLFVPSGLDGTAKLPLVVALHGGLGSGDQFAENTQFETLAEAEHFVVVFPDGVDRTWNGGNCCGGAVRRNIDDVGFLAALIDELASDLPIDLGRVFMTGHSNGGIMAFRFGCERPELVLAIAPVAGSLEVPECPAGVPTNLLAIHGDSDQSHPFEGGHGPLSIAGVEFVSMADSLALWTKAMGCQALGVSGPPAVTTLAWGCAGGKIARLVVIAGADHPWPGGVDGRPAAQDRTSNVLNATQVVWAFFENVH